MSRLFGSLLFVGIAFLSAVRADQVTLKNGDRVTGKIVRSDGSNLVIKSDLLGEVTVALGSVETMTTDAQLYVTLADGRTVSGQLSTSGDRAQVRTKNTEAIAIDRSAIKGIRTPEEQLKYEASLNPGWLEQWTGGADFGFALTSGNSETANLALGLAMSRTTRHDKTTIYAASIYNRDKTGGVTRTIANTIRGGLRYDHNLTKKVFVYGFGDLEHNGLQNLKLRTVLGGGLGYHLIRNERTELDLLGGLAWNKEFFYNVDNDRSSAEAQVGQTLSHRLTSRVSIKEQLFVFPNLTRGGEYRINFDTSVVADVTKRIGWQLTVSDRYLSNPPGAFKKNDLLLTTGLRVKLGELK
jgi:putative salt-induced outer membrane protein